MTHCLCLLLHSAPVTRREAYVIVRYRPCTGISRMTVVVRFVCWVLRNVRHGEAEMTLKRHPQMPRFFTCHV